jgi:Domain of unknown function (DUF4345)
MSGESSRRGLQALLSALGAVAVVSGTLSVLFGAGIILDSGAYSPSVDSEVRFYAAWYAAAGALVLRAVPRVESEGRVIRMVGVVFFVAGCARLLSLVFVGRPHALFMVLMVVEIALPLVILPWQAQVSSKPTSPQS